MARRKADFMTHTVIKVKGGTQVGYNVKPYARFTKMNEGTVVAQDGEFFGAGGNPIDEEKVPEWAHDAVAALPEKTRISLGFVVDADQRLKRAENFKEDAKPVPAALSKKETAKRFGSAPAVADVKVQDA
jgi:hypothetical protein